MKYSILLAMLMAMPAAAQDMEKDTIQLKEVVVGNKGKKIKRYKFWSHCSNHGHFGFDTREAVTLVDQLPPGYVKSVAFYFNDYDYSDDYTITEYQDIEAEVLFYEANDTVPGRKLGYDRKIITVAKDFSGKMVVDVSDMNIKSNGRIFIGLSRLTPNQVSGRREFEVDCYCDRKKYKTYTKYRGTKSWVLDKHLSAIKMEVKVEVH